MNSLDFATSVITLSSGLLIFLSQVLTVDSGGTYFLFFNVRLLVTRPSVFEDVIKQA